MNEFNDIREFLTQYEEEITVCILEDDKHEVETINMYNHQLIDTLSNYKNLTVAGVGSRQFYVVIEDREFTFQISNLEFTSTLSF